MKLLLLLSVGLLSRPFNLKTKDGEEEGLKLHKEEGDVEGEENMEGK